MLFELEFPVEYLFSSWLLASWEFQRIIVPKNVSTTNSERDVWFKWSSNCM